MKFKNIARISLVLKPQLIMYTGIIQIIITGKVFTKFYKNNKMNYKSVFLTIVLIWSTFMSFSQSDSKEDFNRDIIDKAWSAEDTTQKADYEMMFVSISQDSITLAYINWIEGMSANQCSYSKKDKKTCFELAIGNCVDSVDISFVYGYLSENKRILNILFEENKLKNIENIREDKDWLHFELLTE